MAAKRKSTRRSSKQSKKESPNGPELLALELQEIHSAESQLSRVLPRLVKAAESETLQEMLEERLAQGERLIDEVEAALEQLDQTPGRKKNVAAEGLIRDAREHVQELQGGAARDAVMIAAIQKTEHYCIAAWGTAKALAEALGERNTVKSMERALKEGKAMDEQLTELAESEITPTLLSDEADEDDEEMSSSRGRSSRRGSGSARVSARAR